MPDALLSRIRSIWYGRDMADPGRTWSTFCPRLWKSRRRVAAIPDCTPLRIGLRAGMKFTGIHSRCDWLGPSWEFIMGAIIGARASDTAAVAQQYTNARVPRRILSAVRPGKAPEAPPPPPTPPPTPPFPR